QRGDADAFGPATLLERAAASPSFRAPRPGSLLTFGRRREFMLSDEEIREDVIDKLTCGAAVDARRLGVAVKDGVVAWTGSVDTASEKLEAERAAERVHGVAAVANDIEVRLPGSLQRTDSDIVEAAVNALKWNTMVPSDKV